jgi:Uma2 family endonuclease
MSEALQDYRITIEAFRAFIDDRPDWEKWELIDGEIVLNPTATNRHQIIVGNLLFELQTIRRRSEALWYPIPGISTRHPDDPHNEPIPDLMIVPSSSDVFNWTFEAFAVFEVLSPYSLRRDMVHKRRFYQRIAKLAHYVVLAQDRVEATVFARSNDFVAQKLADIRARIEIAELGVVLPLVDLYRDVPID